MLRLGNLMCRQPQPPGTPLPPLDYLTYPADNLLCLIYAKAIVLRRFQYNSHIRLPGIEIQGKDMLILLERRVHVKGRGKAPTGGSPYETVIAEMVVTVGSRYIEDDPGEKLREVMVDMIGFAPGGYKLGQLQITGILGVPSSGSRLKLTGRYRNLVSIPGIGRILGLTIMLETGPVQL